MTLSGSKNQSILLRIAPTTSHILIYCDSEGFRENCGITTRTESRLNHAITAKEDRKAPTGVGSSDLGVPFLITLFSDVFLIRFGRDLLANFVAQII